MNKHMFTAGAIVVAAMMVGGCQKQETVGLDQSIPLPADQTQPVTYQDPNEKSGLEKVLPWNWFGPSQPKNITADDVLSDMSPELDTRAETFDEGRIRHARTLDTNGRSAWDDLDQMLLLDRPSRLSLYPTP